MSNRYKKAIIDDVVPHNIDAALQDNLLELFESAMKRFPSPSTATP